MQRILVDASARYALTIVRACAKTSRLIHIIDLDPDRLGAGTLEGFD